MKKKYFVIAFFIAAIASYLGFRYLVNTDGDSIEVGANQEWVQTGISIQAGDVITISASGKWSHGREGSEGKVPLYGPEGYEKLDSSAIVPEANIGSLIAKVGTGKPVLIGKKNQISVAEGPLFLAMNEVPGIQAYENNKGSIDVQIRFEKGESADKQD